MRHVHVLTMLTLALATVACSGAPPPRVPVEADEVYLERLAGRWSGSYWSPDTARRGRITFSLEATDAEGTPGALAGEGPEDATEVAAHGEVVMIPASGDALSPAYRNWTYQDGQVHDRPGTPTPLHIEIVRAEDNQVTGTLEPYRDPACDCLLSTSFVGTLRGDVIEGTFMSLGGPGHRKQSGRWRVERQ